MADIKNIDVYQTVSSISFEVDTTTNVVNINKVTIENAGLQDLQSVTNIGNTTTTSITASSFIKSGGIGTDVLLADGNTIGLSSIGGVPYTGATSDVNLGEFGIQLGNLEFDNTPTNTPSTAGSVYYNDADGTLDLILKGGNVTLQIGQETVIRVVNKTATNVSLLQGNYQAVRITGAQGQRPKVDLAQATNDVLSAETIGLVTETIANNQEGFITTSGLVRGINTTGSIQDETWVDGDIIYLSPTVAGSLTKVKPVAPNHLVIIGYVIHAHITQGTIFVKVDNGYELDELHNVKIGTTANNNVLAYTLATDVWENKTVETALGYTPYNSTNPSGYQTASQVQAIADAKVVQTITNGVTTTAPSQDAVFDALALKSPLASPTFTGTVTTPAIIVSSETASTIASFDATKNVKSLSTTTYPSLTELTYVKGLTNKAQTQLDALKLEMIYLDSDDTYFDAFYIRTVNAVATFENANQLLSTMANLRSISYVSQGFTQQINADKFVKLGGTSAQYLMADGSISTGGGGGGGATNLSYTPSATNGIVVSDTGTDAPLPLANATNAGLLAPADFTKLGNQSGTNTGDNATNTTSNSYADSKVVQTITNGVTTTAPSQDAVFDALALKANDASVVHLTGAETIAGAKTFSSNPKIPVNFGNSGIGALVIENGVGQIEVATNYVYPSLTELSYGKGVTSAIQTQLDGKVDENTAITGATKTKITYDAKGLVTAGADIATTDISDFNSASRAQTEAELVAGSNITITPSGTGATRQLTIASTGGGSAQTGQIIVTSGTSFTTPSTTTTATVFNIELVGAGGGGGGGLASNGHGSGGGGGGYVFKRITGLSPSTTYTCAIGVGGSGGAALSNGVAGTSTTLTIGGVTYTASGGGFGIATLGSAGGQGGTGTNGDININGQNGDYTALTTAATVHSSRGGGSPKGWGLGGAGVSQTTNGQTGTGYGGGGSSGKSGASTGGNGSNGVIFCQWFN